MERLINSSTLVDMLFSYATRNLSKENNKIPVAEVLDMIDVIPVVEAEPVVHAHWEHLSYDQDEDYDLIETARCSNCGRHESFPCGESPKHCPECGAKMDEEQIKE